MIHELRVYRCLPNRMPALLKRFESAALRLWDKHGIRQAGLWTTMIGASNKTSPTCWLGNRSPSASENGASFTSDPEWVAARKESEKDGPIVTNVVSSILQPTSFSSLS